MKNIKKSIAVGTVVLTMGLSSVTAFAAPGGGQRNNPQGVGIGAGGTAQGKGIGGMKLQDGSCYYVAEDGKLYYTETNELVPEAEAKLVINKVKGGGMKLRDGSCYLLS